MTQKHRRGHRATASAHAHSNPRLDRWLDAFASRRLHPVALLTVVLVAVALTTAINIPTQALTANRAPFLPYFVTLVVVGAVLGPAGGFLALALSILCAIWFWVAPAGSLRIQSDTDLFLCLFYAVSGSCVVTCAAYTRSLVRRLQSARQDLARALEAGSMATWRLDVEADRIDCAPHAEAVLGTRWTRLRDLWTDVHPDDAEAVARTATAALAAGSELRILARHLRPDADDVRWLESRAIVERRADGAATRVMGITMDVTDRQLSLLRAREKASQLEALMEATPALILFSHDPACRRITGLPETHRRLGIPVGGNLSKTAPEPERPTTYRVLDLPGHEIPGECLPLQRAASTGRPVRDARLRVELPDGRPLHLLGNAEPLFDAEGRPAGAVAAFVDITALADAEASLRRSEAVYRTLAEAFPDLVWTSDADGKPLFVNKRWRDFTGLTLEGLQAGGWEPLNHPDDIARLRQTWDEATARAASVDVQFRYRRHDGVYRWFHGRTVPVLDERGGIVQWVGTSIDITDRLEAESQARRLAALVEATPDFVAVLRPDTTLTYMNCAGRGLVGVAQAADITRFKGPQFFPAAVADLFHQEWLPRALRVGSASGEGALMLPDGRELPVSLAILVHRSDRGEVEHLSMYARDISPQRALTQHLREESQRKDEFLATLAHELRNPIAAIGYAAALLTRSTTSDTLEKARSVIARQVGQMSRLLEDLLDMSRIARNLVELKRHLLDLRQVLNTSIEAVQPLMVERRHALSTLLPADPVWVFGDETRLTQVATNLLDNAAKYTPAGGRIVLQLAVDGADAVLRVEDNGIGLPPEATTQAFELFTKFASFESGPREGLGIGLSVVKRLIELHGGRIEASSPGLGQGACFEARLPLAPEAHRRSEAPSTGDGVVRLFDDGLRVLVVDDNRDATDTLSALLRASGYQVSCAYDGEAGLRAFDAAQPDVVLLDLGLPDVPGDQVAQRMRRQARGDVRFIAITGWGQPRDRERTRLSGFDEHLVKPVDPAVLIEMLASQRTGQAGIRSTGLITRPDSASAIASTIRSNG